MCISTMVETIVHRNYPKFHLSVEDISSGCGVSEMNNNVESLYSSQLTLTESEIPEETENNVKKTTLFKPREMKKSLSFAGYEKPPIAAKGEFATSQNLTVQELEALFDSKKKEPSKISKYQIKMYSQKYKDARSKVVDSNRPWYRVILEHSQLAHLGTILACVYLAFRLFPDARRSPSEASTLVKLLYVSSISAVFGTQFWMTFVSGLALFFNVPRHVFGQVQVVIFPIYFMVNALLMLVVIITYTQQNPTYLWDNHQMIQGALLVTSFFSNFIIRIYLAPVLSKLITIKVNIGLTGNLEELGNKSPSNSRISTSLPMSTAAEEAIDKLTVKCQELYSWKHDMAIEKEAGMGSEVATSQPGSLSSCPHYMKLHRAFRKTHLTIAVGNMVAMAATSTHLYYLATKLCSING